MKEYKYLDMPLTKHIVEKIRADAFDEILSICHHAYSVAEVIYAIKKLKEQKND